MAKARIGKLVAQDCAVLVCDLQERFASVITGFDSVIDTSARLVGTLMSVASQWMRSRSP